MGFVNAVSYTAPDGTEMSLRYTLGAQRRIHEAFGGKSITDILNEQNYLAVPRMLFYCAYDKDGNPPGGLRVEQFEESFPGGDVEGMRAFAALTSAFTQGVVTKNELEARILEAKELSRTGLKSGASVENASGSPAKKSGFSVPSNSKRSRTASRQTKESSTTAPASSARRFTTVPARKKRTR